MAAALLTVITAGLGQTRPWSGVSPLSQPLPSNADPRLLRKALYSSAGIFAAPPPPSSARRIFEGRRLEVASPDPPALPPAPPSPPLSPCQRSEVHRVYDWVRKTLVSIHSPRTLRASELSRPRIPIAGDPVQLWPRCSPRRLQLGVLQYACVLVRPIRVVSLRFERVWRRRVRLL